METKEQRNLRMREYMRKIRKTEKYKAYRKSKKFKLSQIQSMKRWRANPENKLKYWVHQQVKYALKISNLAKQPCEVCRKIPAHAHHDDYSKPLEVRWLCPFHHSEYHRTSKP